MPNITHHPAGATTLAASTHDTGIAHRCYSCAPWDRKLHSLGDPCVGTHCMWGASGGLVCSQQTRTETHSPSC